MTEIDKKDARAGETSNHMRWVLRISIALAVVALIAVYFGAV